MRKIISIIILSISINLYGQVDNNQSLLEKFEGMWASDDTSFFTVFTHSKLYGLRVFTFSFVHNSHVDEKIIKIDGDKLFTNITNPDTEYTTSGFYEILNDNTLMLNYTGGNTEVKKSIYYKLNLTDAKEKVIDY